MNPRSLVHVLVAVAVGYLLISAIPQQVAMYSTPQPVIRGGELSDSRSPDNEEVLSPESSTESLTDNMEELKSLDINGEPVEPSLIEYTMLGKLVKWWTLDVLIALTIYWVARRRMV
jgi:hypothetical protein